MIASNFDVINEVIATYNASNFDVINDLSIQTEHININKLIAPEHQCTDFRIFWITNSNTKFSF